MCICRRNYTTFYPCNRKYINIKHIHISTKELKIVVEFLEREEISNKIFLKILLENLFY